jgi:hypothetical protein
MRGIFSFWHCTSELRGLNYEPLIASRPHGPDLLLLLNWLISYSGPFGADVKPHTFQASVRAGIDSSSPLCTL